jgi:cell division protein FtsW (lipid II flippase)
VSGAARVAEGWERTALWLVLALSLLGIAAMVLRSALEWRAVSAGDVQGLPSPALGAAALVLVLSAWVLALVVAARLKRWGWLVACALLVVAIPAFAVVELVEPRQRRISARRHAAFEAAMAEALAEQEAERAKGDA